jgi:outer membrane protein
MKYREAYEKNRLEIQKKENDLTMPIIKKLREVIEDIAKDGGYTMIFEKSQQSVLWAQKDADLTDAVVKAYEKKK